MHPKTLVFREYTFARLFLWIRIGYTSAGIDWQRSKEREIALHVLPPRSPKLNGRVEQLNGTCRREFSEWYDGNSICLSCRQRCATSRCSTIPNVSTSHLGNKLPFRLSHSHMYRTSSTCSLCYNVLTSTGTVLEN